MSEELLEQFINYLSVEKGLRPKSLEAYRRDLQDWLGFAQEQGRTVTDSTVEGLLQRFSMHMHDKGLSPRSMARKTSALKESAFSPLTTTSTKAAPTPWASNFTKTP